MFFFPMGNLKACHDQISIKTQSRPDSPNHNLVDGYALPGTVTSFKMNVVMNSLQVVQINYLILTEYELILNSCVSPNSEYNKHSFFIWYYLILFDFGTKNWIKKQLSNEKKWFIAFFLTGAELNARVKSMWSATFESIKFDCLN